MVVLKSALRSKMPILKLLQKSSPWTVVAAKCASVIGTDKDSILRPINPELSALNSNCQIYDNAIDIFFKWLQKNAYLGGSS